MKPYLYNLAALAAAAIMVACIGILSFVGGVLAAAAIILPLSVAFPFVASLPDTAITTAGLNFSVLMSGYISWRVFQEWDSFCYAVHGYKLRRAFYNL